MAKMKLGVIGLGNMAGAIVSRLLQDGEIKKSQIMFCNAHGQRKKTVADKFTLRGVPMQGLVEKSTVILIAVKPQHLADVLPRMTGTQKSQLILSVLAGKRMVTYERVLGKRKIIRVMPNSPALVGEGMSVYFANKHCTRRDKNICEKIFSRVGVVAEIKKEGLLDVVTALSGSGPAYVFKFASDLMAAGEKLGLSPSTAKELVYQTFKGSVQMMCETKSTLDELIDRVKSKGGTTHAGLKALKKKKFTSAIEACIRAAHKRAREL